MQLKIVSYNAQDLFLNPAYEVSKTDVETLTETQWQQLSQDETRLKSLVQLRGMAQMVEQEQPDILCLCEIGGLESLQRFNRLFLDERYEVLLKPGHSHRGIENGFLVKKGLALHFELVTHMNWSVPFTYPHEDDPAAHPIAAEAAAYIDLGVPAARRLSRDIPALFVKNEKSELILVILMVHLKSGFDIEGIDPGGKVRRAAELRALVDIRKHLQTKVGEVPIIIAGDFNGNASREKTASEFLPIYQNTDLDDVLWLAGRPLHERLTHFTFFARQLTSSQLDYIFIPPSLVPRLLTEQTYVYRYRFGENEEEIMFPTSFHDRRKLPSDHYPVVCVLDV